MIQQPVRVWVLILSVLGSLAASYGHAQSAAKDASLRSAEKVTWENGRDYFVLPYEMRWSPKPVAGEVEVLVPFLYTYGTFVDGSKSFEDWLKRKPGWIRVERIPNVRWPHAREQARLFLTLKAMGREDMHNSLYDWVYRDQQHFPIYHSLFYPDVEAIWKLSLEFAKTNKLDLDEFSRIYWSHDMMLNLQRLQTTHAALGTVGVDLLVGGRYAVNTNMVYGDDKPWSEEAVYGEANLVRVFQLVEYLADRARQEAAAAAKAVTK